MSGNHMLAEIAAGARLLGWSAPLGIDHTDYAKQAVLGMWAITLNLRAEDWRDARWLEHAYAQEARDLSKVRTRPDSLIPSLDGPDVVPIDLLLLAYSAPSRWAMEVALLADGRRRTGRAQRLVESCRRIQLAMTRHGVDPVGRDASERATRLRDDGRARGLYLLSREAERMKMSDSFDLWGSSLSSADARPTTRGSVARERGGSDDVEGWDS